MIALAVMLALAVAVALIGAVALLRLATPLEKLHPGGFVAIAGGACLGVAAFLTVGPTGQSLKMALIVVVLAANGAVANHAIGRALHLRGGARR